MKIQQLENLNVVLDFLREEGFNLVGLGAEDILDKNPKLILGLIWQLIYFYHIKPQKEKEAQVKKEILLRRKQREERREARRKRHEQRNLEKNLKEKENSEKITEINIQDLENSLNLEMNE